MTLTPPAPALLASAGRVTDGPPPPRRSDACVSDPLLHRVFVVVLRHHGALLRAFVLELKDGVDQHQDAQRQDAGDHHGDGVDRGGDAVEGHHDVHVVRGQLAVSTVIPRALQVGLEAAHPVLQNRLGISRLHRQLLVVKLPVVVPLVEVGIN